MNYKKHKQYDAFISYRHADNKDQGRQWATWLHQAIEKYPVPDDLVGKENNRGEIIPSRIYPVFRDEEELSAQANLGKTITQALDSSKLLIVLCSPNAVESSFVADEIDYFKQQGNSDRIIAAIINGEPNASWDKGKLESGFKVKDECFPLPIQFEYDEQGQKTHKRAEPIAADFRVNNEGCSEQGWTHPEAYRQYLKSLNQLSPQVIREKVEAFKQQQHLMLLKVIAGILGVPLGNLSQRDKNYQLKQQRKKARRLKQWLFVLATLIIIAIGLSWVAHTKQLEAEQSEMIVNEEREKAEKQRDKALLTQSHFLMNLARKQNKKRQYSTALLLGLNAMPGVYGGERPNALYLAPFIMAIMKSNKKAIFKHKAKVYQVAFSPNEEQVVTASDDGTAVLWDIKTGHKLNTLLHNSSVKRASFSPNGKWIVTASNDETAIIWNAQTGEKQHILQHEESVYQAIFSANSQWVVTRPSYNGAVLWDVQTGKRKMSFSHEKSLVHIAFSPDGQRLITASYDNTAVLWSVLTGKALYTFQHASDVRYATFSPDGHWIATVSDDKSTVLWSAETGEKKQTIQGWASRAVFSPDSRLLIASSIDKGARIWNIEKNQAEELFSPELYQDYYINRGGAFSSDGHKLLASPSRFKGTLWDIKTAEFKDIYHHRSAVYNSSISANGENVITASYDGTAVLWDTDTEEIEKILQGFLDVHSAVLSPDEEWIVTLSDKKATLSNIHTGKKQFSFIHNGQIDTIEFSFDSQWMLTVSNDEFAILRDVKSGHKHHTFSHDRKVTQAFFSSDGKRVITVSADNVVNVWNSITGKKESYFKHDAPIIDVVVSADGQKLIIASKDDNMTLWRLETGKKQYAFQSKHPIKSFVISADDQWLATVSSHDTVDVRDMSSGQKKQGISDQRGIGFVGFSPNSQQLIIASEQQGVSVWSIQTGKITQVSKESLDITQAMINHQGTLLLAVTDNERAILWNIETGEKQLIFTHPEKIKYAKFSLDDKSVLMVTGNGVIKWRNLPLEPDLVTTAIAKLPINRRCLTPDERKKFLLPSLTHKQWQERGCPQYSQMNKESDDEVSYE